MAPLLLSKLSPFFLLRVGLAFSFFYPAIASFVTPTNWVGFFPLFLRDIFPDSFLLITFSLYEIVLGVWLLSGKFLFYAALLSFATLAGVVILNLGALDLVFRDVGLAFSALALALGTHPKR